MAKNKITREIFSSLVAVDGRNKSVTQKERDDLTREIYQNTKKYLLGRGVPIAIKEGHDDRDQNLKGIISSIKLREKVFNDDEYSKEKIKYLAIESDIILSNDLFKKYKNGIYPGASIERVRKGYLGNGEEFGNHFASVALLGKDMGAFPELEGEFSKTSYFMYKSRAEKFYTNKKKEFYDTHLDNEGGMNPMNPEQIIMLLKNLIDKILGNKNEDKEEQDSNQGDTDMSESSREGFERVKEEFSRQVEDLRSERETIQKEKIELAYKKLEIDNNITIEDKEKFVEVAQKAGLELAESIWGNKEIEKPPEGENFKSDNSFQGETKQEQIESKKDMESYKISYDYLKDLYMTREQIVKTIGENPLVTIKNN